MKALCNTESHTSSKNVQFIVDAKSIDIYDTSNSSPNNKKAECLPKTLVCGLIGLQIGERINVPICRQHPFKHWLPNFECGSAAVGCRCANKLKRFMLPEK